MKDITQNVRLRKQILANITLFDEYDIRDEETPEIIAEKIYGSPDYHWVIMLCNEKYNYLDDFPLPVYEFEQYVKAKYGSDNINAVHHYETVNGDVTDTGIQGIKVTYSGFGYTSSPMITITQNPQDIDIAEEYVQATAIATISDQNSIVASITGSILTIVNASKLFQVGQLVHGNISIPTGTTIQSVISGSSYQLSNPVTSDISATALYITDGQLLSIDIVNAGKGYIHMPTITIDPPVSGTRAKASVSIAVAGPVSNYDYEIQVNESKRRIKLISPSLLNTILKNFNDLI
jgi:hypothetical protein